MPASPAWTSIDHDNPKDYEPDLAKWRKRLHVSADPGRLANLHLRADGQPRAGGWPC